MSLNAAAFDALPIQVWTSRPDGTLDYVNSAVTDYFCVTAASVLTHGWKNLCHPHDLIEAVQRWTNCLQTGEPYEVEFRLLRGVDRQYRWHVARALPVHDGRGAVTGWVGTNTDIDFIKRAQELGQATAARAHVARERFRLLLSQAPVAITVTEGPEHRVELSNWRARQIVGGRNIEGLPLVEAFPHLAGHGALERLDHAFRTGERIEDREVALEMDRNGDGVLQPCWFDSTIEPLRDASDAVTGLMVVSVELTATVLARREVERLLAERAAVLENLPDGVIITDGAGRITFVNRSAEALHGCALLDVPPEHYADAYSLYTEAGEPHPVDELPLVRAILRDEVVRGGRWRIRRSDGSEVLAQGDAQPLWSADGHKIGAVLVMRDVTP